MWSGFMIEGVPAAVFWTFVGLAIVNQGVSKSGFAGGAGILSLPLMMLVMPVHLVPAVMLPLLILCDMNAIYHHRRNVVWRSCLEIYLPSIVGIFAGAVVWWMVGREGIEPFERPIKAFVGGIALLFACYIFVKETAQHWIDRYTPGWKVGAVAGIAAGFSSTIAHAAGPIVSLFIFAKDHGKTLFVGTVAWTFTLINLTKLPFYLATGLIDLSVLQFDLFLIPLIPIGSFLGKWMHDRVPESLFNRIIFVLIVLAAVQLIFDANLVLLAVRALSPS